MEVNLLVVFLSFLINLSKRYSSEICSHFLAKYFSFENKEINELKEEIRNVKKERDSLNPIDQFAKFALADRKINKLADKLKDYKSKIQSERMKKMMYFNVVFTVITVLMSIYLIWTNYDKPVIDFSSIFESDHSSKDELNIFFPFGGFMSFPNKDRLNSIGVTAWLFIVNRFIDISINKFNSLNVFSKIKSD